MDVRRSLIFRISWKTGLPLECKLRSRSSVSTKPAASSKLIDTVMLFSVSLVRIVLNFSLYVPLFLLCLSEQKPDL